MKIPALAVRQWLSPEWDNTKFEPAPPRGKPEPQFYIFSISASLLKKLTGIYRRDPSKPPSEDMGIQRRHMPDRSEEILRYIRDGFPLSRIDRKRLVDQSEIKHLSMPGWLPTAEGSTGTPFRFSHSRPAAVWFFPLSRSSRSSCPVLR